MPLHIYNNIYESGKVPSWWKPIKGSMKKFKGDRHVVRCLRTLLRGRWKKVIKYGVNGEVHYHEHASGKVADVKFYD
jgi:hypothetical protein